METKKMPMGNHADRPRSRSGFVLVATAMTLAGMVGVVGLAVDVGHVYVAKNELQVYVDEAAAAAAFELDATAAGLARARDVAAHGPGLTDSNRWEFATRTVSAVETWFATAPAGPFVSNPGNAAGYRFIRLRASASVPLHFLRVLPGVANTQTVQATATACQCRIHELGDGLTPLSPTSHNNSDPDFGFTKGQYYTLRWAPGGQRKKQGGSCAGDVGFDPGDSSERGYVDVGQGNGSSRIREALVNSSFFRPLPLKVGDQLNMLGGQKSIPSAMEERFGQDTDTSALLFRDYRGNGRRLMYVAVNDASASSRIAGFALFFLPPVPCGTKNVTPCCGEYVGPAVQGSHRQGAGSAGLYAVRLIE